MTKRVLLAVAAVLAPSIALGDDLPRSETGKPETSLTGAGPNVPQAIKDNVEAIRRELNTAPKPTTGAEGKPADGKAAEKGGQVSSKQELMWEEDVDEFVAKKRKAKPKKLEEGISEVHVVQPGDTLWDLSSKFLNSPWLWPRVWSYNPHITNPHWIYPGQVIRFAPRVAAVAETEEPTLPRRRPERIIPGHVGIIGFRYSAMLTKEELKAAGKLENSPNDALLLTKFQTAYVGFAKAQTVKVGDKFLTARPVRKLDHPITKKEIGTVVQLTGELEVTATAQEGKFYTTTVRNAWRTVQRSDLVIPWENLAVRIERRTNAKDLRGYVLGSVEHDVLGKYSLVFIDLGAKDGIEAGNLLRIVRRGDGYLREEEYEGNLKKMPLEEIGEVYVLSPKTDFAVGLVLRSTTEVQAGDKADLRKGE